MMRSTTQPFAWAMISAAVLAMSGCAAFRPIPGIPASALPPEYHAVSRADESTIDLSLLAQVPPHQHYVDGGDVLGIYIEGVLGRPGEAPPITVPQSPDLPPAIGYPISVRDDGTLSLPMVGSIMVRGLTIRQVEEKLRYIYTTERDILRAGQDRIIVSLQRPRQVRVLVLRQESGGPGGTEFAQGLSINLGQTKRGNGQAIDLPIYHNDVLHALARTGGLPGLDAENTIYIIRRQHLPHAQAGLPPGSYQPTPTQQFVPTPNSSWPSPTPSVSTSARNLRNPGGIQQVAYEEEYPGPQPGWRQELQQVDQDYIPQPVVENAAYPTQGFVGHYPNPVPRPGPMTPLPPQPGYAIHQVQARNFHATNPLDELRAGMDAGEWSGDDSFSGESDVAPMPSLPLTGPGLMNVPPLQHGLPGPYGYEAEYGAIVEGSPSQPQGGYGGGMLVPPSPMPQSAFGGYVPDNRLPPSVQHVLADHWNPQFGPAAGFNDPTMNSSHVIKIPVRLKPGETPRIRPEDVLLQDGDIVFIETRETEIFYTGGLLGGGQFTLPRDYDLDVLGAIAIAQAANQQNTSRQIGGVSAINGDVTISASNVVILRQLPHGQQVSIKVDLYRAIRDPSERVLIQPGDIVMLRYKALEAVGAFVERNLLESALFGIAAATIPTGGGN